MISSKSKMYLVPIHIYFSIPIGGSFPREKVAEACPSSTEVKNEWNYTSTTSPYASWYANGQL